MTGAVPQDDRGAVPQDDMKAFGMTYAPQDAIVLFKQETYEHDGSCYAFSVLEC